MKEPLRVKGRRDGVRQGHAHQGEQPCGLRQGERVVGGDRERDLNPGAGRLRGAAAQAPVPERVAFVVVENRGVPDEFHIGESGPVVETARLVAAWRILDDLLPGAGVVRSLSGARPSDPERRQVAELYARPRRPELTGGRDPWLRLRARWWRLTATRRRPSQARPIAGPSREHLSADVVSPFAPGGSGPSGAQCREIARELCVVDRGFLRNLAGENRMSRSGCSRVDVALRRCIVRRNERGVAHDGRAMTRDDSVHRVVHGHVEHREQSGPVRVDRAAGAGPTEAAYRIEREPVPDTYGVRRETGLGSARERTADDHGEHRESEGERPDSCEPRVTLIPCVGSTGEEQCDEVHGRFLSPEPTNFPSSWHHVAGVAVLVRRSSFAWKGAIGAGLERSKHRGPSPRPNASRHDALENLPKEAPRQVAFRELQGEVPGMSDEPLAGLEEPLLEARQGPA